MSRIPRLLDEPLFIQLVLIINAIIGTAVYIRPDIFSTTLFIFAIISALVAIMYFRNNFVFQARILLLIIIGYYAALIKIIDPNAYFSPVGLNAQTLTVGARMFGLTSIAMLGAIAGLMFVGRRMRLGDRVGIGLNYRNKMLRPMFLFYVLGVILAGYLSAKSYGPNVFEAEYASAGEGQLLGNLQSIGVICLVMCFVSAPNKRLSTILFLVFLAIYFLGWGIFIRGGRLEVLSGLIALFVALPAAQGRVVGLKLLHYIAFIILALFMQEWGTLRDTLSDRSLASESIIEGYRTLADKGIYFAGTISGIDTTFSNIVHMMDHKILDWRYGSTYFDYLLRTPPAFLYPDRPQDLSWMFSNYGYEAMGGFFELSEAYLNFGIIGCLVVPFLVSFIIASTYKKAVSGNIFWYFILVALLSVYVRGAWYQTFAFYKGFFTGLVMYLIFLFMSFMLVQKKTPAKVSVNMKCNWDLNLPND